MSPGLASAMRDEIEQTHRVSGATIHFSPEHPLSAPLVERILQARLKEEAESGGPRRGVGL
jgi:hypothetical protein